MAKLTLVIDDNLLRDDVQIDNVPPNVAALIVRGLGVVPQPSAPIDDPASSSKNVEPG